MVDSSPVQARIDLDGIVLAGPSVTTTDRLYDVLFDGRRIWSFWSVRDGEPAQANQQVAWPSNLKKYLVGHTEVALYDRMQEQNVFAHKVSFTADDVQIAIVNPDGVPLSLDKDNRLVGTFETRGGELRGPLLDAIEEALSALQSSGVEAFLAYGTALGAIRDGQLIGHDSDADLGYVSRHSHPVDMIRESFALQRSLQGMGYRITRYSFGAFKIYVPEADGVTRGLDVFGGFLREGMLYLLGEIYTPYRKDWIYPLQEATLDGRSFPVPRRTDEFLTATYGPHWRTPDPAFKFTTPESTKRMFNGYFRGTRVGRSDWDRHYSRALRNPMPDASALAHFAQQSEPEARSWVDIGCGRGADLELLTRDGAAGLGLDFQTRSFAETAATLGPQGEGREVAFQSFNLSEIRSVLAGAALAARLDAPRILLARHLVDTIGPAARANLWRACELMMRGGQGRLYVEFMARNGKDGYAREHKIKRRKVREIRAELEASGAVIESVKRYRISDEPKSTRICRLVVSWPQPRRSPAESPTRTRASA